MSDERNRQSAVFRHHQLQVPLTRRRGLPTVAAAEQELNNFLVQESEARQKGENEEAQRARALAERKRRMLERIRPLPEGQEYPFAVDIWKLGDAVWVALEGEPYYQLQEELTARFPNNPLILMPLANGSRSSYLPTREAFETQRYQVDVALLVAGSLEALTDAIAAQIAEWIETG